VPRKKPRDKKTNYKTDHHKLPPTRREGKKNFEGRRGFGNREAVKGLTIQRRRGETVIGRRVIMKGEKRRLRKPENEKKKV